MHCAWAVYHSMALPFASSHRIARTSHNHTQNRQSLLLHNIFDVFVVRLFMDGVDLMHVAVDAVHNRLAMLSVGLAARSQFVDNQ